MAKRVLAVAAAVAIGGASTAMAAFQPYGTPDGSTLHLYHLDEASGATVEGNPFVDSVAGGVNLTNTGGPTGRSGTTAGGYGAAGFTGYGSAFSPRLSGNGNLNNGTSATGGGAATAAGVNRASLTGADGAFTWEAVVRSDSSLAAGPTNNWYIVSHDGVDNNRGSSLQIQPTAGNLVFTTALLNAAGTLPTASTDITVPIPKTGDNGYVTGQFFHVAVAYDGNEGTAGNLKFYWTKLLASDPTEANLIGTGTLNTDLVDAANRLFVGASGRNVYRHEFPGRVDEVRISSIARAADDFGNVVAVPEPATLAALAGGALVLARRRRVG